MEFLNTWLRGIIISVVITTVIEMILPDNNNKKYVKIILGIYVVFNIITPIINKVTNNGFEISSIINIGKYTKEFETYEVNSKNINIEDNNENSIKNIYVNNLKNDMKNKIEEKGYIIKDIKIELEDDESYSISKLIINVRQKNKENEKENKENDISLIEEIKEVDVSINNNENTENNIIKESSKDLSEKEKKELIDYIKLVYEIKENRINIY